MRLGIQHATNLSKAATKPPVEWSDTVYKHTAKTDMHTSAVKLIVFVRATQTTFFARKQTPVIHACDVKWS